MLEFVIFGESEVLERLSFLVSKTMAKHSYTYDVQIFNDSDEDFKKYVSNNKKRVIYILYIDMFLDCRIDIVKYIRSLDKKSILIIISNSKIAECLYKERLNIFTLMSKCDICESCFTLTIEDAIKYILHQEDFIKFSNMGNIFSLNAKDILYIIKNGRKTLIKTNNSQYEVYKPLNEFVTILPDYFEQTHRSCIVNMHRVCKISIPKKTIYFDNGEYIDYIGKKYKDKIT